ncbi:MAG: amino acid ABC transporter permease, partial [bacterium]
RAGIVSIDKGQYEAAKVLGMSYKQTMQKIVVPQAFKRVLPPICNEYIVLIKDTALVSVIGMEELLRATKQIVARDFTMTPFLVAAVIYLIITAVFTVIFNKLEKKFSIYE